ncbi:hypothetical protein CG471_21745 [Sphingobium sp. IP1]|uniref:hypothetical protein n=1 Tax=Sphingobium sp. IP1 TaxID=2021637 RepID=UPI000C08A5E9|nr:hypothetical protein [Sphingobium sp. IP1]PHP17648.1 hypothetical protein CG471_21745 [Sphingobium sp. IP1]
MKSEFKSLLSDILSEDQLIAFAEEFGGTRLYVPCKPSTQMGKAIIAAIGEEGFTQLSTFFGQDYIRVPLLIILRANRYRGAGLSNAVIGRRLGMTETGVNKIFSNLAAKGELLPKGSKPLANVQDVQSINSGARCFCCGHYNPERETLPEVQHIAAQDGDLVGQIE